MDLLNYCKKEIDESIVKVEDTGEEVEGYRIYEPDYAKDSFVGLPIFVGVKGNERKIFSGKEGLALFNRLNSKKKK